ncbi:MAG: hypothetical protein ABJF88_17485 [Rhodothermales bacterium]
MRANSLLLLTAVLFLAACDSNDDDGRLIAQPGRFSATVTIDGGDRLSFDGLASASPGQLIVLDSVFVGEDSLFTIDSLRTSFMITLGAFQGTGPGHFISLMRDGERPEPGTYTLGGLFDPTEFSAFFSSFDRTGFPGVGTTLVAESGTLTVEASSDERIAGRFEFRARSIGFGEDDEAEQAATVRGAFDAQIRAFPDGFPRGTSGG